MLLVVAFFTSYILQQKKVTAVHETVISIFAGEWALFLPCAFLAARSNTP